MTRKVKINTKGENKNQNNAEGKSKNEKGLK